MPFELQPYREPLNEDELGFLVKKEQTERKQYYKVYQFLMCLSFIIPFIGSWYRAVDGDVNAFSKAKFFAGAGVLLAISTLATVLSYRFNLRKLQLDIRQRTKNIEISRITRKLYFATQNTCYFYIDSCIKFNIEVSIEDFQRLNEGDEVSVEYTTHAHQYLDYF